MRVCVFPKPRYSDGDLTLIYSGGDECSSGFQRMSVINFECNETAGERARRGAPARGAWEWRAEWGSQRPLGVAPPSPSQRHTSCFHFPPPCLLWEWAQRRACWDGGSALGSTLTSMGTDSASWACSPTPFLVQTEVQRDPLRWWPHHSSWIVGSQEVAGQVWFF